MNFLYKPLWTLLLLLSAGAAAEKVYMPFFELINVHSDYQYAASKLFKSYLEESGVYQLVIPSRPDSLVAPLSQEQARAKAREKNCRFFTMGEMNRIGETVIISMTLYQAENGSMIWSDKLKASSPDDIDPILQKLARAMSTKDKAAEDGDIYSVTSYHAQSLRQVRVNNAFGISLGGVLQPFEPFTSDPFAAGGGFFWYYDARTLLFELDAQNYILGSSGLGMITIGVYKPVFPRAQTPFYGGGLGMGFSSFEGTNSAPASDGNGLIFYAGGGYLLNRTSNVGLRIHGRYFIGAYKMDGPDKAIPMGVILNLELYFGK